MSHHRIVDADCHILEPPDIWDNWLPERHREKAPKLVKDAQLKVYKGAPHGMPSTLKDQINTDLLAFFKERSVSPSRQAIPV